MSLSKDLFTLGADAMRAQAAQITRDPACRAMASATLALSTPSLNTARNSFHEAREAWQIAFAPTPRAQGTVFHHYADVYETHGRRAGRALPSESGFAWVYFYGIARADVDAWLASQPHFRAHDVRGSHDCTGETFAHGPYVRQVGQRWLVELSFGLDV